jgi:phage terminase large subunit
MEWADNPYLDGAEVELLTQSLSNDQLESRRYGRFKANTGLVYPEFEQEVHVIEPFTIPKDWQDQISIDPGLNNPLSAHWYAVDYDGNVYVVAEHFLAGKDVEYHSNEIRRISDSLGWHRDGRGRLHALIDPAGGQKTLSSPKSVIELFYENGIVASPRVNKDIFSGIQRVKSYLKVRDGKPKLFIFPCCVNLIRELKTYRWGEGEKPEKKDDHALDELRYYIMTKPENLPPKPVKTEIQKDKERLIRKLINERKS